MAISGLGSIFEPSRNAQEAHEEADRLERSNRLLAARKGAGSVYGKSLNFERLARGAAETDFFTDPRRFDLQGRQSIDSLSGGRTSNPRSSLAMICS